MGRVAWRQTYGAMTLAKALIAGEEYNSIKTDYSNLAAKMSLYPGLYVLGAISSLGKITFCRQRS